MDLEHAKRVVERAVGRSLVTAAAAHESLARFRREAEGGGSPDIVAVLREVTGLDGHLLEALDDTSMRGRMLGGFRLLEKLGEGAMGAVWRAEQTSLGREVAVKLLDPALALRPGFAERFQREARTAARLDHPNVVQPIEFGEDDGFLFFAMELMEGGSAAARLSDGPLSEEAAIGVGMAMAEALGYAQAHGIVHRDVKPDNILFSRRGVTKLADLGLVLDVDERQALTEPGLAMGTPDYMAPEQARGRRDLDVRTDIYGLGITLYELVIGERPFQGVDALAIVTQHLTAPLPDLRARRPELSEAFCAIVRRMCAKERDERFADAGALHDAFNTLALGDPDAAVRLAAVPGASGSPTAGEAATMTASESVPLQAVPSPARRRLALLAAFVALALVVAAVLKRDAGPTLDREAEARAVAVLVGALGERRAPDGAYGEVAGSPTDAWVSGAVLDALARLPAGERVGHDLDAIAARMIPLALDGRAAGDAPGFAGFPYVSGPDNVACTEATAGVGSALAVATPHLVRTFTRPLLEEIEAFLLRTQNPDGSWSTIPVLGESGAMTSATVEALNALCDMAAVLESRARVAEAVALGAVSLAGMYVEDGAFFDVNPRRRAGPEGSVPGLNEEAVLALLTARDLLRAEGAEPPPEIDAVTRDFAEQMPPHDLPPEELTEAAMEDYRFFDLPSRYRTSATEFSWLPWTWRVTLAHRLAREPGFPRPGDWRREELRLRAQAPRLAEALAEAPATWKPAEALLGLATVRGR